MSTSLKTLDALAEAGATFTLVAARGKAPIDKQWQRRPHSLVEAQHHLCAGGNVGLLTGALSDGLILLDLDARAPAFSTTWPALCTWAIIRADAPDRAKYVVRCAQAPAHKDRPAGLEVLATGNHGVVAGTHAGGAPLVAAFTGALPLVTLEELGAVWQQWTGQSWERARPARVQRFTPAGGNASHAQAGVGDVVAVRMLLAHIPSAAADDYNTWVKVGFAVKHVCGQAGLALWDSWSTLSGKYDAEAVRCKWEELAPNGSVGLGTLVHLAGGAHARRGD